MYSKKKTSICYETFAAQAGIAIEKARQFERANKQIEEINLLREISARISSQMSIDQILDSLVVGGRQLLGVEMATAHILDEATGQYSTYAAPEEKREVLSQPTRGQRKADGGDHPQR